MANAKKCDRCGNFYTLDISDKKDNIAMIALMDKYERILERLDICQYCRESLDAWLENGKVRREK